MGARISGIGTNRLIIEGVEKLHGTEHRVCPDHIEIGSFVALSAISGGELLVDGIIEEDMWMIQQTFARVGIQFTLEDSRLTLPRQDQLIIQPDMGNRIPTIDDAPWPQFPSDLMSPLIVAATQAQGTILFHEKMFESRMFFVDRLVSMGAAIILCDPHRCVVTGPVKLHQANLTSPDIRAGMAILMAALLAGGESIIQNADMIDRGYENIDGKLAALGAEIERTSPCD
jgi:UDP-N-acetylglucosamine 1-carboxyvinyltransferase